MSKPQLVERDVTSLRPYARNARRHSRKKVKQIAASIERFGFTNPVLVSDDGEIIARQAEDHVARGMALREQRIFDIINDSFPARYKARLKNRSHAEGASKEGKALEELVRDRERPKGKREFGYLCEGD